MRGFVAALALCCVILPAPGKTEAGRMAFLDPLTGELKAHGFVSQNAPGDTAVSVADDFALEPHRWKWDGTSWQPFSPPASPSEQAMSDARSKIDAAIAAPGIPPQVKDALDAIKKVLR